MVFYFGYYSFIHNSYLKKGKVAHIDFYKRSKNEGSTVYTYCFHIYNTIHCEADFLWLAINKVLRINVAGPDIIVFSFQFQILTKLNMVLVIYIHKIYLKKKTLYKGRE